MDRIRRILYEHWRELAATALAITALFIALYIRKQTKDDGRTAPYREALVPEGFWQSCPPPPAEGSADRPLVVWIVRHWLPTTRNGATTMAYEMSRFLVRVAGWQVVILTPFSTVTSYQGVLFGSTPERLLRARISDTQSVSEISTKRCDDMPVIKFDQKPLVELAVRRAHVIMTQYQVIETAAQTACNARKPLVLVAHDDSLNPWIDLAKTVCGAPNVGLINNSEWLDTLYRFQGVASTVVYPPIYVKDYKTHTDRTYVTLVNCNAAKGAKQFYEIARQMPDVQFLAVAGFYGDQVAPPRLSNLTAVKAQQDMRKVYSRTKILLVPSEKESWGRVAIEAASSGIPVVASTTPGLKEALGPAGIFCERDDIDAWVTEIRRFVTQPLAYEQASRAALRRATALDPTEQLERMRAFLLERRWLA
jgi:glycosyltransferase involved in cell wall biosynthesis